MNGQLRTYAKITLKNGLAECTEDQRKFFKRMYSHSNLAADIDTILDSLPDEKLERAMEQVEATLTKNKKP